MRIQSENNKEIERLFHLDYGEVGEFRFRMIGSFIGAGIIWLYTGWILSWIWIGAYSILQLAFYIFLRLKADCAEPRDVVIAHLTFPFLLASYVWMPILMITSPDDVLSVSGFCILAGVIVFIVRRSEEHFLMMLLEIAVLTVYLAIGVSVILNRYDDPLAWLGLIFGAGTLVFYVSQGATIVRRQRLRADQVAARTSQAEKLEAIGKLAGGVAHDFNNILTVILGNLDLFDEFDDSKIRNELVAEVRSAAMRGAKVVSQLLSYARQTDGTRRKTEANDLLKSVEALCRTLIPASVTLKLNYPLLDLRVCVDDALFVAALLNLIKNGVDAIDGNGTITIFTDLQVLTKPLKCAAGQNLGSGEFVAFSVVDTGHGISAGDLDKVTDPFFTTKAVGEGSGLGLSMVAGFAIESGGGLEIISSTGGTAATILLPLVKLEA